MENPFQEYLNIKINELNAKGEYNHLSINDKLGLIKLEILGTELFPIIKNFEKANVDPIIEKCIYIECIINGLNPIQALDETKKQMEDRK